MYIEYAGNRVYDKHQGCEAGKSRRIREKSPTCKVKHKLREHRPEISTQETDAKRVTNDYFHLMTVDV